MRMMEKRNRDVCVKEKKRLCKRQYTSYPPGISCNSRDCGTSDISQLVL